MNAGMTRTRFVRKAIARSSGTWSDCALRCGGEETSTTTIRPATSTKAAARWPSRIQFQSVGRIAAIIRRPA